MRERHDDLIYDVGLHDGSDTAFYLHQGFRVIAIDADPHMIDQARQRFPHEVEQRRLTLLNIGIAEEAGAATFWICDDKPEWNSFDRAVASRLGHPCHSIQVPTIPFRDVLEQHGVPHYLKVDIEGYDYLCIRDLRGGPLPVYASMEAQASNDGDLDVLRQAGYKRFKLIQQGCFQAARRPFDQLTQKVMASAAYGRLRPLRLGSLVRKRTDRYVLEQSGFEFQEMSSGPWGEDTPGPWRTAEAALDILHSQRRRNLQRNGNQHDYRIWYDWHATI